MSLSDLNVIVICNDTLRADVVDHTWEDHVNLPNLDRLRAESTLFTHAFGEGMPTVPMRRGFYTGKRSFPWNHNIDDTGSVPKVLGWHAIPPEHPTLAELLCEQGVLTGLVTDLYHMFKPSMNFTRGFVSHSYIRGQERDRVRSGPISKIDIKPHLHPKETDPDRHSGLVQYLLNTLDRQTEEDYFVAQVFRKASSWVDDNCAQGPFMLWVDSFTPHEFWDPPKAFADAYFKKEGVVDYLYPQFFQSRFQFNEDEIQRTKALYYGYCTFMDKWLGNFFKKLDEHKLWDNTVVVFTSDHGTELHDRNRFGKGGDHPYAFNTRLNMIVRHPDTRFHGQTTDALVQNIDLAPTICNWMGVKANTEFDGYDLMPSLEDPKCSPREYLIGAFMNYAFVRDHHYNFAVNTLNPAEQTELFDLKADPKELENIANAKPEILKEMRAKLEALLGGPLPARYGHQVSKEAPVGINQVLERWKGSNLA